MSKSFLIKDYMNEKPVTTSPDTCLTEIAQLTIKNKVSGVLVIDESKQFLGMISELDCLKAMAEGLYNQGQGTPSLRAKDIMNCDIVTATPDSILMDVVSSMLSEGQRRRPVIEDGKLVGQVTCRQLLKLIDSLS